MPSSFAWPMSSAGASQAASASSAALRKCFCGEVADGLAHHRLLVVGREVEEVGADAGLLARGLAVAGDLRERAPGRAGGAESALGRAVHGALGTLAEAEPVEHVTARECRQGPEPEAPFLCLQLPRGCLSYCR